MIFPFRRIPKPPFALNLHKYHGSSKEIRLILPVFAQNLVNLQGIVHVCVHNA